MKRTALVVCLLSTQALAQPKTGYSGLGAESVSKAELAKFVAPPLDPSVSRRIQAMLDVRGAEPGVITSKGDRMFYTTRVTNTSQVWRQDGAMKFPIQMTGGEDRTGLEGITPDGKWLVLSRDVGGEENPGLFLQPASGGPLRTVQKVPKVQTFLDFVTEDGKELYFHANDAAPDSYAIYRFDLASGTKTLVFGEKGLWSVGDHLGSGADLRLLLVKATGSVSTEYAEYVPATKRFTPTGGVTMPTARLTMTIRPKCTGSIPKLAATGARMGARMMMAAKVSMNMPTTSRNRFTTSRKTTGFEETPDSIAAMVCGACSSCSA